MDVYISPDANIANTGNTFVANSEQGFLCSFYYNNTSKGAWQHFEFKGKPVGNKAAVLLYPTTYSKTPATTGYVLYKNVEFKKSGSVTNLFPQSLSNNEFTILGNGRFECMSYYTYTYDYSQKLQWSAHGFYVPVDTNSLYTYSFDAYISEDADIPSSGRIFIANGEMGFPCSFYYDAAKKGTWQHFEYTGKPTSKLPRLLIYPTTGNLPATKGYITYRDIRFQKNERLSNHFKQPTSNEGFEIKSNGVISSNANCKYKYDYAQNLLGTVHGCYIAVDPNQEYTYSVDVYISPDANIANTGNTFVANSEQGFLCSFYYDNTRKGAWQHFEFKGKPVGNKAAVLLYPTTYSKTPATTGYVLYKNVEFKKSGSIVNLFPQVLHDNDFTIKGNGQFTCEPYTNAMYKYDYAQNQLGTVHGFDIAVDLDQEYTYSMDVYISPDANIADTGNTFVANSQQGFLCSFYYDNTSKGAWQHFEFKGKPVGNKAAVLLYPTTYSNTPATTGYVLYKNVEFKKSGSVTNLFPQSLSNNDFTILGNGRFECMSYCTYTYDYSQKLQWTAHGFYVPVDFGIDYTFSFDAYISEDADIPSSGRIFIANGEMGFPCSFYYDAAKKGTWQHFEYTGKPTSTLPRLLIYPTTGNLPATKGYIMYRNIQFKCNKIEWPLTMEKSNNAVYRYDLNNRLDSITKDDSVVPIIKFIYDNNGNRVGTEIILQ